MVNKMGQRTNRELLMLASVLNKDKHRIGGMFCSEKLDGVRAIWIPASRGKPISDLPFANLDKKTKLPIATGLFSRYGNIIYAPDAFLDRLPTDLVLDGELYIGRQQFQQTISIVKRHPEERDDNEWKKVKLYVFDSPSYGVLFQDGKINNPNFKKQIVQKQCLDALGITDSGIALGFEFVQRMLSSKLKQNDSLILHKQELLPFKTDNANQRLEEILASITDEGGEGLMLRHPSWAWEPLRSTFLNKYKRELDDEATVLGYISGKGKHLGRLGSLRCKFRELTFDLGGFTDAERTLLEEGQRWADANPGSFSDNAFSLQFPIGSIVSFTYRELTDDKVPKEARYFRLRPKE